MTSAYICKILRTAKVEQRVVSISMKAGESQQGRISWLEMPSDGDIGLHLEVGWTMAGTLGAPIDVEYGQSFFFNTCDVSSITLGKVCIP